MTKNYNVYRDTLRAWLEANSKYMAAAHVADKLYHDRNQCWLEVQKAAAGLSADEQDRIILEMRDGGNHAEAHY